MRKYRTGEFIPSQLQLFRFIPISVSEPMRIIPNQSEKRFVSHLMKNDQKSIRFNPINFRDINPNESEPIRNQVFNPDQSESIRARIDVLELIGLIFDRFSSNEIQHFFRIGSK